MAITRNIAIPRNDTLLREILKRDYLRELNNEIYIRNQNTIDWLKSIQATAEDPFIKRRLIEAYEQYFGTKDKTEWTKEQHRLSFNRVASANVYVDEDKAMYDQLMGTQMYSQQERLRKTITALNPTPTLENMLVTELSGETMDIIGETGEEYGLNLVQTLGFIIDMYRQFSKKGENQTLSDINNELAKLKEGDTNEHNANSKWDKFRVSHFGRREETGVPF